MSKPALLIALAALAFAPLPPPASATPVWDVTLTYVVQAAGQVTFSQLGAYASVIRCDVPWTDLGTTEELVGSASHVLRYRISYSNRMLTMSEQIGGLRTETLLRCDAGALEPAVIGTAVTATTHVPRTGQGAASTCEETAAFDARQSPGQMSGAGPFQPGQTLVCPEYGGAGLLDVNRVPFTGGLHLFLDDPQGQYYRQRLCPMIGGVCWPAGIDHCTPIVPQQRAWHPGQHQYKVEAKPLCVVVTALRPPPTGDYWAHIRRD